MRELSSPIHVSEKPMVKTRVKYGSVLFGVFCDLYEDQ
jgi:hypothetical protein